MPYSGCQLKTFKTFILMVKPLKPLFFSEKPLKTFICHDKPLFSGKAVFLLYRTLPIKCTLGRNSGIFGILWFFQMAGYVGQLGLACSWIPRREIEPQLVVTASVSSEACPVAPVTLVKDGVRNEGGLSNVAVNKGMLVSVKSSHKAYMAQIEEERKNGNS